METNSRASLHPELLSTRRRVRHLASAGKAPRDGSAGDLRIGRDQRRLAAIVSADVVHYSLLMGRDDSATLAGLKAHRRELIDPKVGEYSGRIVKTTGDGLLLEFASVVDSMRCALDVQRGMAERNVVVPSDRRIEFRIGINAGEIIVENGDVFGDCVNVAARLQELAEPGGICVSSRVYEDACGKLDATFEDAGERQLKNIARPVRIYRMLCGTRPDGTDPRLTAIQPLAPGNGHLPGVLSFETIRGDFTPPYFTDGMAEEIIKALSRIRSLFVVARNRALRTKRTVGVRSTPIDPPMQQAQ
jgi:adenylate cyclase